jgi:hypothetical protein
MVTNAGETNMYRMKAVVALTAAAFALTACEARDEDGLDTTVAEGTVEGTATGESTVSVGDITEHPDNYIGRTVTVVADLEEVLSPMAFTLDEDDMLQGGIDNDLLVFSRQSSGLQPIDDQWLNNKVRVTGTVGRYTVVELERELGWDLDTRLEAKFKDAETRPVIIATSISRTGTN